MRRALAGVALACAIGAAPAAPAGAEPRALGLRPDVATAEGGLWAESDKAEQAARRSGERNSSPELNAYVTRVACGVAGDYCPEIRIYLMERPFFNATMAPNGYMEVWSGLMLRAENEAQLSFVLGHEIGHFKENHSIEAQRALKNRMTGAMVVGLAVAVAGAAAAVNSPSADAARSIMDATRGIVDIVYLGAISSFFAFSRENETDADGMGFRSAVAAGYDPNAGAALWRNLVEEQKKSDFEKVRREEARGGLFNTHPLSEDRIRALDTLARGGAPGRLDREAYRATIRPHLGAWLRDDLRRRDFGQSFHLIERLMAQGEDLGTLNFYKGEALRMRRKDGDLAAARLAYEAAIAHADAPAPAWRELGDIARWAPRRSARRLRDLS